MSSHINTGYSSDRDSHEALEDAHIADNGAAVNLSKDPSNNNRLHGYGKMSNDKNNNMADDVMPNDDDHNIDKNNVIHYDTNDSERPKPKDLVHNIPLEKKEVSKEDRISGVHENAPDVSKSAIASLILGSLATSLNLASKLMTTSVGVVQKNIDYHRKDASNYGHIQRSKKWWEFVLLFSILTGIEVIHAVEAIYVNPMLLAIGIPATYATMIWSFSPVLGLISVPLLGSLSDKCRCTMGRRRPFIIFFSVGMIFGLILLGFGPNFSVLLGDTELKNSKDSSLYAATSPIPMMTTRSPLVEALTKTQPSNNASGTTMIPYITNLTVVRNKSPYPTITTSGAIILQSGNEDISSNEPSYKYLLIFICVGVIIMDYSADSGSSPALSYMLDITLSEQHTLGLTLGTTMTGTGGLLGYLIGSLDWEKLWPSKVLRNQFQIVFIIALGIFIITAFLTLTSFKEMPLYYVKVDKAEYAERMSISRSLYYASDRSHKRKYGPPRMLSRSFCLTDMHYMDNKLPHYKSSELADSSKDGVNLKKLFKYQDFRLSLPDLGFKPKDNKKFNMRIAHKKNNSNKNITTLNNLQIPTEINKNAINGSTIIADEFIHNLSKTTSESKSPTRKIHNNNSKVVSLLPQITLTSDGGQELPTILENDEIGIDKKSLDKESNSKISRNKKPKLSITGVLTKSKFQDFIIDKGIEKIKSNDSHPNKDDLDNLVKDKSLHDENNQNLLSVQHPPLPLSLSPVDSWEISASLPMQKEENLDSSDTEDEEMTLKEYVISIVKLPRQMAILCLTHLFCWMAFLCFASYFSDFVGQSVFKGSPTASPGSNENLLYEMGIRYACISMFLYALTCILYSTRIKRFASRIGTKRVYIFGISYYCVSMAILGFAPYKAAVMILAPAAGILQASLLSIPFIFISLYHKREIFNPKHLDKKDEEKHTNQTNLPQSNGQKNENVNQKKNPVYKKRGIGTDVAIVSSMVFWAQLIVSLTLGHMIDALNTTLVIPFYGCGLSALAIICSLWVTDCK
ncbi:unnamed protein product [Gordionus sp. m RMFG-2023]